MKRWTANEKKDAMILRYLKKLFFRWALSILVLKAFLFPHVAESDLPKCPPDGPYHDCYVKVCWQWLEMSLTNKPFR